MTRSRRFFASSPWIATGTPDYVNLGYTSRGLAKQALMRLSRKSLAIFRKLGLEWNVGCERCHGPGSDHVEHPSRGNILNLARMDYVEANDACIQCHSQGRPLTNPIEGKYYDWPVGYRVGLYLCDFWQLEDHTLGEMTFTHFPDGTAHKNRMQGNDFAQSVMYRRGVTCFSCHDVHGTDN